MATHKGSEGLVKIGSNVVAEVTGFSFDETDTTGQGAMTNGASVALDLFPEGADSGDTYFSGTAIITSISRANAMGAMVTASFSFQGTGALGTATV